MLVKLFRKNPFSEIVVQRCSLKKVFLKILQNSQENTCARIFFLMKLKFSRTPFFIEHLRWLLLHFFPMFFRSVSRTQWNIEDGAFYKNSEKNFILDVWLCFECAPTLLFLDKDMLKQNRSLVKIGYSCLDFVFREICYIFRKFHHFSFFIHTDSPECTRYQ